MKKSRIFTMFLLLAVVLTFAWPTSLLLAGCSTHSGKVSVVYVVQGIVASRKEYDVGTTISEEEIYNGWVEARRGYNFDGWYFDSLKTRKVDGAITLNTTINLYASSELGTFTITFDTGEGGSYVSPITMHYGSEIIDHPSNPTRSGYQFVGWSPAIPETMPDHNITITATWQEV